MLSISALVYLAGSSVIRHVYGYNDDYHMLLRARTGAVDLEHNEMIQGGRYLFSPVIKFAFSHTEKVKNLSFLRAIGLVGLAVHCLTLFMIFTTSGWKSAKAAAASCIIGLTPTTAVWLSWAFCFSFPFVSAITLALGWWTWRLSNHSTSKARRLKISLSVAGLIASFAFYQAISPFWIVGYWLGFCLDMKQSEGTHFDRSKDFTYLPYLRLAQGVGLFLFSAAAYFLVVKLTASALDLEGQDSRTRVDFLEIPQNLLWLADSYFIKAIGGWGGLQSNLILILSATLGIALIMVSIWSQWGSSALKMASGIYKTFIEPFRRFYNRKTDKWGTTL